MERLDQLEIGSYLPVKQQLYRVGNYFFDPDNGKFFDPTIGPAIDIFAKVPLTDI